MSKPINIKRGTTQTLTITLPIAINPVGATVYFTVKDKDDIQKLEDSDSLAIIKKILTNPTGQVFTDTIDPADTNDRTPGRYVYGITIKNAAGEILGSKANGLFILEPRDTADVEEN